MTSLSFLPVAPWPILFLLAGLAAALIWWPAGRRERTETGGARGRRSAVVLLLLLAATRPALPGTDVRVDASSVDVYFVVDTTTSSMARDYAGSEPRLAGMRTDLKGVAAQLPGARFTVLSFDLDTTTRLPLTSDATALYAAADTLRPETSRWSRGSSVTVARTDLVAALQRGQATHPDRARLVFYLGDGEQTAETEPQPFEIPGGLVNGGAVLGYGTAAGGPMATTGNLSEGDVVDPSTGKPAISTIDEKQLAQIADQLGVPYLHRQSDDAGQAIVDAVHLTQLGSVSGAEQIELGGRTELYWVLLLAVALVGAWELGLVIASLTSLAALKRRTALGRTALGRTALGRPRLGRTRLGRPPTRRQAGAGRRPRGTPSDPSPGSTGHTQLETSSSTGGGGSA
ncbi:vWA domain-containing protein [Lapillicoccus sp.]|uniref:vWA domain-containing protein n=1 Tax=Lapillicoccus sp. TaxID=1909287 RepID=UPI0032674BEB